jgi:co-chaperonin GroES (HSP10)
VDTLLKVIITGAAQVLAVDKKNRVRVKAGDTVQYHFNNPTGIGTPVSKTAVIFEADKPNECWIGCCNDSNNMLTAPAGGKEYHRIMGSRQTWVANTPVPSCNQIMPTSGAIKDMYVKLSGAPGVGANYVFSLYYNGATSALTCTVSDAATTSNDLINSVRVAAGLNIALEAIPSTGTVPAAVRAAWGFTFVPDRGGESLFLSVPNINLDNAATEYATVDGGDWTWGDPSSTDTRTKRCFVEPCHIYNLYVGLQNNPGVAKTFTFTIHKNEVATPLVVAITNAITGNNNTNVVDFKQGDYVSMEVAPTGAPAVGYAQFSFVQYIPSRRQLDIKLNTGRKGKLPHPDMGLGLQRHPRSKIY